MRFANPSLASVPQEFRLLFTVLCTFVAVDTSRTPGRSKIGCRDFFSPLASSSLASPMRLALLLASISGSATASDATSWRSSFDKRYDAVVLGSGPKESLLASLLASNGKSVLQLEPRRAPGGVAASLDLGQLYERMGAPGEKPEPKLKLGTPEEYSADVAPKVLMAGGKELEMLVSSGLWQQMDFRRVHRSFLYRTKPDGSSDVHRVLVTAEAVLKSARC